jgi:hypothetical protein
MSILRAVLIADRLDAFLSDPNTQSSGIIYRTAVEIKHTTQTIVQVITVAVN